MPIVNRVADLQPDIQAWRRDIHENPELLYEVHRTAAFVADRLREYNIEVLEKDISGQWQMQAMQMQMQGMPLAPEPSD